MIPFECKVDEHGFLYIEDYKIKEQINYFDNPFFKKAYFFKLYSTSDYIIKYHINNLKRREIFKMLYTFYNIASKNLSYIDFPIGYYKENNKLKGLIVRDYHNAPSISKIVVNDNLGDFYNHANNEKDNVLHMLYDILKILDDLYKNGIIYTDIHPGNFLVYENEIKIIDFDPHYLFNSERDKNNHYLKVLLRNYKLLVEYVCRKMGKNYFEIHEIDVKNIDDMKRYIKINK